MVASEATLRTYEVGPYPSQVFRHPRQADRLAVEGNSAVAGRDAVFAANLIDAYLWVFVCLFHEVIIPATGVPGCRGAGATRKNDKNPRGVSDPVPWPSRPSAPTLRGGNGLHGNTVSSHFGNQVPNDMTHSTGNDIAGRP